MINLEYHTVICDKCGKEIVNEEVWFINQLAGYGSRFDGEMVSKQFCDDCLDRFLCE